MPKILIAGVLLAVAVFVLLPNQSAHAIGDTQECYVNDPAQFNNAGLDSNDGEAMIFTASSSYNLGGIKWNAYRNSVLDGETFTITINPLSAGLPDLNTTLGSESWDTTLLPVADATFPFTDNTFSCNPLTDPGQVVEFDPPVPLTSSVQYAIVIRGNGTNTSNDWIMPYTVGDVGYLGGMQADCNAPGACTLNSPATWDSFGNDLGFATYDNIVIVPPRPSADTWLDNFLRDFLGLDSEFGRLFFFTVVALTLIIGLIVIGVHPIFALAVGGFSLAIGTLSGNFPVALFLAGFALAGVSVLLGATAFSGSGED